MLSLRIWRPDVVVTDSPSDELARTVNIVVRKAFEVAADPDAFPDQIKILGLQPWASRKLLVALNKSDPTAVREDLVSPLPRLGDCAKDYAAAAFRLWGDCGNVPGFRLVATRLQDTSGQTHFFDGISLAPGGAARREQVALTEKETAYRAELQKAHERKRTVQAIIDGKAGSIANSQQALSQLGEVVKTLPAMDAGKALFTAATAYARSGQWALAREAYLLLLHKYPGHPLALDAARWVIRYQSSSEARRRYELGQFIELTELSFEQKERKDPRRVIPKAKTKDQLPPETEIIRSTHREPLAGLVSSRKWYEGALELEGRLGARRTVRARRAD